MRTSNYEVLLAAASRGKTKFESLLAAARKSVPVVDRGAPRVIETIDAADLAKSAEKAGLRIETETSKVLTHVRVFDGAELVAYGASGSYDDALMHALLGAVREGR